MNKTAHYIKLLLGFELNQTDLLILVRKLKTSELIINHSAVHVWLSGHLKGTKCFHFSENRTGSAVSTSICHVGAVEQVRNADPCSSFSKTNLLKTTYFSWFIISVQEKLFHLLNLDSISDFFKLFCFYVIMLSQVQINSSK